MNTIAKPLPANLYAVDGLCHNAQHDTMGHECGKPATWLGIAPTGFGSGFCDHCKRHGDERHAYTFVPYFPR